MRHAADLDDYELQVDELRGLSLWFAMLVLLPLSLLLCAADGAPARVRRWSLAAAAIACTLAAYAAELLMLLALASLEGA